MSLIDQAEARYTAFQVCQNMRVVGSSSADHDTLRNMPRQMLVRYCMGTAGKRSKARQSGARVGGFVDRVRVERLADNAVYIFGRQTVESFAAQCCFDHGKPVRFRMG